ncbi:MAG: hypothetical protein KKI12_02930 [Proteobacteria bacterium]|nr:hypothetical protein [Pseudomonadota bacterium]MBU4258815.1 hypothetical protein [Pseudomonadota bacterium]MBU4287107.1 hypothetical protein [Pseudomonadota bacterium]MBU4415185.1 hypothetical protein [Pseudomonadota bacterium]MCG2757190.1 hypothetical protein [Desulfobacteraceae bacterium]
MVRFQAKDIQRIVQIPKHRYEYIASKIGIKPDVEEVEGQGHVHIYSFKNLLQFAFAHHAGILGLTPKASRGLLSYLDEVDNAPVNFGIYDSDMFEDISIHYVIDIQSKNFCATYTAGSQEGRIILEKTDRGFLIPGQKASFLYETVGFITINVRSLKKKIVANIDQ